MIDATLNPNLYLQPSAAAAKIDDLEAKIVGLQNLLRVSLGFPPGWNLSPGEERLLSLLTRRGDQGVTHDAAAFVVSSNAEKMAGANTVRDALVSLRRKVAGRGITIESLYGRGFAITGESLIAARSGWSRDQA